MCFPIYLDLGLYGIFRTLKHRLLTKFRKKKCFDNILSLTFSTFSLHLVAVSKNYLHPLEQKTKKTGEKQEENNRKNRGEMRNTVEKKKEHDFFRGIKLNKLITMFLTPTSR